MGKTMEGSSQNGWSMMMALIGIELSIIGVLQKKLDGYEWLVFAIFLIITVTGFFVYWRTGIIRKWWAGLADQIRVPLVGFGIAASCYALLEFLIKAPPNWVWGISGSILGLGFLISYFSIAQRLYNHDQSFMEHSRFITKTVMVAKIASNVFFFDRIKKITIVFTHRPDKIDKCGYKGDYKEVYLRPSIPVDEEECVSLINHFARSAGVEVNSKCSCELIWKGEILDKELLKENLVVIGSSTNPVAEKLYTEAGEIGLRYRFGPENENSKDDIFDIYKNNHSGYCREVNEKKAYGLITRMKNPLSDNDGKRSYVIMLSGGHREGQKAITRWIDNPDNLHEINEYCPEGAFQYLLRCTYDGEEVIMVKPEGKWHHREK